MKNIKLILLCVFSILLGVGNISEGSSVLSYISILCLGFMVLLHAMSNLKVITSFFKLDFFLLLMIFLIMAFSQSIYGDVYYSKGVFNYQYLFLIVLFVLLKDYFVLDSRSINYSLLFFSLGVSALVIYALLGGGVFNKGQLIVFGQNPNSTASRVVIAMIYILYTLSFSFVITKEKLKSGLLFLLLIFLSIYLVKSGSRGSLISLILSVFVLILFMPIKRKHKIYISIILAASLFMFYLYVISDYVIYERWFSILSGSTAGRTDIWKDAYSILYKNPIIGVGEAGYFQEIFYMSGRYIDTHNVFIYLAVTGGLVSLICFLIFLFLILKDYFIGFNKINILSFLLFLNIIFLISKTGGALVYFVMWYVFSICCALNIKNKNKV